ncbi:MAG: hypothetical protein H6765_07875 [Candidatus Peribacteria bacterium]|nr:MAG: hypothetical protein H6765_07875 [Candidatus Peribacteria bacterium]
MSKVIHLSQHGKLTVTTGENKETTDVIIEVDLDTHVNSVSSELAKDVLEEGVKTVVLFPDQKIKLKNLKWKKNKDL